MLRIQNCEDLEAANNAIRKSESNIWMLAKENDRHDHDTSTGFQSPLNSLRLLLKAYSHLGILPGRLSPDGCSFVVLKRNYAKVLAMVVVFWAALPVIVSEILEYKFFQHYLPGPEEKEEGGENAVKIIAVWKGAMEKMELEETLWLQEKLGFFGLLSIPLRNATKRKQKDLSSDVMTDNLVKHADGYGALLFFLVTLYLNHRSLKSCYRVTSRLAQGITQLSSPSGPLVHHLILILCNFGLEIIEYGETFLLTGYPGYPSTEPASLHSLRLLRLLVCSLGSTYFFIIVAVPELIIGRLVESMTEILVSIREEVSKGRISAADFCRKADIVRNSYSELGKVFGNNMLLLILVSLTQLIWKSYSCITIWDSVCFSMHGNLYDSCVAVNVAKNALLLFIHVKRLIFLTGHVHEMDKQIGQTIEVLIELRARSRSPKLASMTMRLLERSRGLSLKGFFIVDRAIFPALLGHFLTYFIVLLQFRLSEKG